MELPNQDRNCRNPIQHPVPNRYKIIEYFHIFRTHAIPDAAVTFIPLTIFIYLLFIGSMLRLGAQISRESTSVGRGPLFVKLP